MRAAAGRCALWNALLRGGAVADESTNSACALAALVLVLRASGSVRGDVAVLRNRHAPAGDVFAQTGVEGTNGGAGSLRCRRVRILRLGLSRFFERIESQFTAGLFVPGILVGISRGISDCLLVWHAAKSPAAADHLHAVRAGVRFPVSGGWADGYLALGIRSGRGGCHQRL